jgi:hypothetical protein
MNLPIPLDDEHPTQRRKEKAAGRGGLLRSGCIIAIS